MHPPTPPHIRDRWTKASKLCRAALIVAGVLVLASCFATFNVSTSRVKCYVLWARLNVEYSSVPNFQRGSQGGIVGFAVEPRFEGGWYSSWWFVRVPLWAPLLALGGAFAICEYRRRTWHATEHCTCGYDLRGVRASEAGRTCPECGRRSVDRTTTPA